MTKKATAKSCSNIAFIKYWGNTNDDLRIAASPSLSMNLADLYTIATVHFDDSTTEDSLHINQTLASLSASQRVFQLVDGVRRTAGLTSKATIHTETNFPAGAGIASSAAAFSALALASATAAGLNLSEAELSALARRGSGSACRSIPDGFCEWLADGDDDSSYATSIAPADYWDLCDIVAVVSTAHKQVGSTGGHRLAGSSPLQVARLETALDRFNACKAALLNRDLATLGPIIEADAVIMHSVMMSSQPPLYYWLPETLAIMQATQTWRDEGLPVYFTIDAGPNVHLICEQTHADAVVAAVQTLPGIEKVFRSGPGGPAQLITRQAAN